MIYEKDLDEAIAVCQGDISPNANTCIKLAAFLTLKRELYGKEQLPEPSYSFASGLDEPVGRMIEYKSDTEFSQAINGRDQAEVWPIMDEMMTTVQVLYPRLYDAAMRKLQG